MRMTEQVGSAPLTNQKRSRRRQPAYQGPDSTAQAETPMTTFDGSPRAADAMLEAEFVLSVRAALCYLVDNVAALAHEAGKLKEFNVEVEALGNDGVFRAWIVEDAKITFSVDERGVRTLGSIVVIPGQEDDETLAMRLLVKSIIEDPCNEDAVRAAAEIHGFGKMRRALGICKNAARIARRRGLADKRDSDVAAAKKLLENTWIMPVAI